MERPALKVADHFVAVYDPIVSYLKRNHVKQYSVVHNAVGYGTHPKQDYAASRPLKFICVGRQVAYHKDPTHIVEAISELKEAELVLIGTGDLNEKLRDLARRLKCEERCRFIPSKPNRDVLFEMARADVFVFNQLYLGISKAIIEAALVGLPIVVNLGPAGVDELDGDWLIRVNDSKDGYLQAMRRLLHEKERELFGRKAYAHAYRNWRPEQMEAEVAEIYLKMIRCSQKDQH